MSLKDMVQNAREGNMVRFTRAFRTVMSEKLPAAIHAERVKMADRLFHPKKHR